MLRKIRLTVAVIVFALVTLLFLDFTGTIHTWLGGLAKIQFIPAVLALNVGVVAALLVLTLLLGHTVFCVPYILMEVKARLVGMDPSLEEAARDLGAGPFRAFWDITLPLIMPAVLSGSLLAFAMSMDDVVISIFVNGPRISTLPIKVYTQLKTGVTPKINALCTIMLAVTVAAMAVYSLIKRRTDKGNFPFSQKKK